MLGAEHKVTHKTDRDPALQELIYYLVQWHRCPLEGPLKHRWQGLTPTVSDSLPMEWDLEFTFLISSR